MIQPDKMTICRICQNSVGNTEYVLNEIALGLPDQFEYFECAHCGCLQIKKIPADLSKYYAEHYHSFNTPTTFKDNFIKAFIKIKRTEACLYKNNLFGRILVTIYRPPEYFKWLTKVNLELESSILDVGCGAGDLLVNMKRDGFNNVTGVDPFINKSLHYPNGVMLFKKSIYEMDQQYDFIMLHHSFEHMPNPHDAIKDLFRLLKPERYMLIRIPIASSYAWETYRQDWVQLDPPRHFFLHTVESMRILAEQAGLEVKDVIFDSSDFQFWGSEQIRKGIGLLDKRSYQNKPQESIFSKAEIAAFKARAVELNRIGRGDQACFYLYKP